MLPVSYEYEDRARGDGVLPQLLLKEGCHLVDADDGHGVDVVINTV